MQEGYGSNQQVDGGALALFATPLTGEFIKCPDSWTDEDIAHNQGLTVVMSVPISLVVD
jgi:hypothetical protein